LRGYRREAIHSQYSDIDKSVSLTIGDSGHLFRENLPPKPQVGHPKKFPPKIKEVRHFDSRMRFRGLSG